MVKVSCAQDKDQLETYVLEWREEGDRDDWSRTRSLTVLARLGLGNIISRGDC